MRAAFGALILCSGPAGALWPAFHTTGRHHGSTHSSRPRSLTLFGVSTQFDWDLLNNSSSALLAEGPKLRSDAWFENLVTIPQSCILKRVGSHLAATALWASAVVCADYAAPWTLPVVNPTPLQVLGTAISLLLAFRTSQSYDRYWNGRDVWSDVWFSCRGLKRCIVAWSDDRFLAPGLCLVALYPIVLVYHLRSELSEPEAMRELKVALDSFTDHLAAPRRLSVACLSRLNQTSSNLPLTILEDLTVLVRTARNDGVEGGAFNQGEFAVAIFESHIDRLNRALCNAEKIVTTPVPPSYTRHTSRLLTLYSLALPLILVNVEPPWIALPCVLLVSWALFALEEIGKIIEEPFGTDPEDLGLDLPLERYAILIANDVLSVPAPLPSAYTTSPVEAQGVISVDKGNDTCSGLVQLSHPDTPMQPQGTSGSYIVPGNARM